MKSHKFKIGDLVEFRCKNMHAIGYVIDRKTFSECVYLDLLFRNDFVNPNAPSFVAKYCKIKQFNCPEYIKELNER